MTETVELALMVLDAYKACVAENMNCPWCSGRLASGGETHDEFCRWAKMKDSILLLGDLPKGDRE